MDASLYVALVASANAPLWSIVYCGEIAGGAGSHWWFEKGNKTTLGDPYENQKELIRKIQKEEGG